MLSEPITARDPRRWVTLAVVVAAAFIVVLDNSVLTVAIPTILRDFHTTLPAVEWVITGYALTFASLLIIGGRLGDVFGHRRIFVVGAGLFCGGSLLAALSWNVPSLIVGEAVIEGIGASLMLPTTLSIISTTFHGRERATAFGAWGAAVGVGVALGPVVGGFLTTNYAWRWAFGINVIVAPLAIVGALTFIRRDRLTSQRIRIDNFRIQRIFRRQDDVPARLLLQELHAAIADFVCYDDFHESPCRLLRVSRRQHNKSN